MIRLLKPEAPIFLLCIAKEIPRLRKDGSSHCKNGDPQMRIWIDRSARDQHPHSNRGNQENYGKKVQSASGLHMNSNGKDPGEEGEHPVKVGIYIHPGR